MKEIDWIDLYETIMCKLYQRKYDKLFERLSKLSERSYKVENIVRNNKHSNQLTKEQRKIIKDYWKKYTSDINFKNFNFYMSHSKEFNPRYISNELFAGYIEDYFNNLKLAPAFGDKNYFELYLNGFKIPKTYIHCVDGTFLNDKYEIINQDAVINILLANIPFVIKETISTSQGDGVKIVEKANLDELTYLINNLKGKNYIFQEKIKQCDLLAQFNNSSVNVIRIVTYMLDNKIYTSNSKFRVGLGDSNVLGENVVNFFIDSNGKLSNDGFDSNGLFYENLLYKMVGHDVIIPNINQIKDLVMKAAQRIPHFKLIGWDIAIDKKYEPVIIEYNITSLAPDFLQLNGIPFFEDNTENVLEQVFVKKREKKIGLKSDQYI